LSLDAELLTYNAAQNYEHLTILIRVNSQKCRKCRGHFFETVYIAFFINRNSTTVVSVTTLCSACPQSTWTLYGHIKTAEQRSIIQQYGDWYTGRWWVGCYIGTERSGLSGLRPYSLYQMYQPTKWRPVYQLR